jgi:hypothetical protein
MTQELLAAMLGVRREGVTEVAGRLQAQGVIKYSRGNIQILDRDELEKRSCECYAVVKKEIERLLPYEIHSLPRRHKLPLNSQPTTLNEWLRWDQARNQRSVSA